jgi:hypothetical protein
MEMTRSPRRNRRVDRGEEVDVHIWKHPEDESMEATFTISVGRRALCHYATKAAAIECLDNYLDELN